MYLALRNHKDDNCIILKIILVQIFVHKNLKVPNSLQDFDLMLLRACLHVGGGPHLAVVEKWPAFTCKLATPESRGDVTRRCCVVAKHVNWENGRRTTHFGGHCSFPLFICSRCNISMLWLFTVTFDDTTPPPKAVNCNMNSTPARRVTPTSVVYMAKCDPGWQGYPTWQTGQPHLSCKHAQIKIGDYMKRQVTSPTWGPPPPCKQALRRTNQSRQWYFALHPDLRTLVPHPVRHYSMVVLSPDFARRSKNYTVV